MKKVVKYFFFQVEKLDQAVAQYLGAPQQVVEEGIFLLLYYQISRREIFITIHGILFLI